MTLTFWGQSVEDLGTKWQMRINKLFIQSGKAPRYSINGKLLREAIKKNVGVVEVVLPEAVITKTPYEWLRGEKIMKVKLDPKNPMDFYMWEVPVTYPREGKKKETYQAIGQLEFIN